MLWPVLRGRGWGEYCVFFIFLLFLGDLFQAASQHDGEGASGPSAREAGVTLCGKCVS